MDGQSTPDYPVVMSNLLVFFIAAVYGNVSFSGVASLTLATTEPSDFPPKCIYAPPFSFSHIGEDGGDHPHGTCDEKPDYGLADVSQGQVVVE